MKTLLIFVALAFLPCIVFADLSYPGMVFVSTKTPEQCQASPDLIRSWHWECAPGIWKVFGNVSSNELVAVCVIAMSATSCHNEANAALGVPSDNRRWVTKANLTAASVLLTCSGNVTAPGTAWHSCPNTKATYVASGGTPAEPPPTTTPPVTPPPVIPPPVVPTTSGPAFTNVTTTMIPLGAPAVPFQFSAALPDLNGDGWLDAYLGTHNDAGPNCVPSAAYLQVVDANGQGTGILEHISSTASSYTQCDPPLLRISSRPIFGNWFGNPNGIWSFYGHDADGLSPAKYRVSNATAKGGIPAYETKAAVNPGVAGGAYLPMSLGETGALQLAMRMSGLISIRDIGDARTVLATPDVNPDTSSAHAVVDIDNDGQPEVLVPSAGGYFAMFDGAFTWVPGMISGALPDPKNSDGHMVPFDYDADGDQDLFIGQVAYSGIGMDNVPGPLKGPEVFTPFLYRNEGDGTFTNVTNGSGITGLKATYYLSSYGNTVAADVNLDGYPDLIYGGETRLHSPQWHNMTFVPILMNDGDGTFTVNKANNFLAFDTNSGSGRPRIAVGDVDNDGRIDLAKTCDVSSPIHSSICIFRNVTNIAGNHWLRMTVSGTGNNTDGLHATIIVKDPTTGDVITSSQVGAFTTGYQSLIPHMGTGSFATADIDIDMPNGLPDCHLVNVATDARYHVTNACGLE
jgi:hypothetical protein